jgi:hypothetical protein
MEGGHAHAAAFVHDDTRSIEIDDIDPRTVEDHRADHPIAIVLIMGRQS